MKAANEDRPVLTDESCWLLIDAGCNANEIAAFAGLSVPAARAWMHHAMRHYAEAA